MKISFLIFSILILVAEITRASKVPSCEGKEDLFAVTSLGVQVKNLEALPKLVYVAKNARYYIESKKHSFQLISQQSFLKGDSKIICSTPSDVVEKSFSLYAPTLIDLSEAQKIGNSFWQFHVSVSKEQLGVWNQKTRMFSKTSDIEKSVLLNDLQLQIQQISHDEFEMIFIRESGDFSERLSIRFDAAASPR